MPPWKSGRRKAIGGYVLNEALTLPFQGRDVGQSVLIRRVAAAVIHFPEPITGCDSDCNMQLELGAAVQ